MKIDTNRRSVLVGLAATVAAPAIMTASRAYAKNPSIKVGYVTPATGPLAGFAEADDYVLDGVRDALASIQNNGKTYSVEIIKKDSQSNPNRAAEVAADLILDEEVDFIIAAGTPDTTNPVADQAEINEVPCVTSDCPWQPYFFGRGGNPAQGFEYTYHFFWGLEDIIANFTNIWNDSGVNKKVGGLFPNDADGNAWGHPELGLPSPLAAQGFELIDPGRYQPLNDDFTNYIAAFKDAGVEIVTGVMIPPDFGTFWAQAAQQGFKPKVATVGKALLFPSVVQALGDRGIGLTTEVWWSASHPFQSSLTGASSSDLANGYTNATGRPWTQPIGFRHALSEVIADVVSRSEDLGDVKANVAAIRATNLDTIVGNINFAAGPVPNVTKTPLVGGQWQDNGNGLELVITNNKAAPGIPLGGETFLLG